MKMNRKLKRNVLFVLSVGAIGAFALGGFSAVNTPVTAADSTGAFYMDKGAAVSLSEGYGGIRWTTVVSEEWLADNADATLYFGTLVAPVDSVEELTVESAKAENSPIVNVGAGDISTAEGDATYYSAIAYDSILDAFTAQYPDADTADVLKKAYALELTARSYALVNGEPVYADAVDTTRSARQVANMAVLSGETESKSQTVQDRVEGYVGTINHTEGEVIYDLSSNNPVATQYTGAGTEIVIGAKHVDGTIANGIVTLKAEQDIPYGETWVSVFDDSGVYSVPAIVATKVLTKAEDFSIFKANNDTWNGTGTLTEGYYILGNDIDARNYDHGDGANGLNSANIEMFSTSGGNFGFTGTFDGRGHVVEGITVNTYGIFGATKYATIKNVAFTNVFCGTPSTTLYGAILGGFITNSTIENVYIQVNNVLKDAQATAYGSSFAVVSDFYNCTLENCVFNLGTTEYGSENAYYGSFARTGYWAKEGTEMTNVYVISNRILTHTATKGEYDAENYNEFTLDESLQTEVSKVKRYENAAAMTNDTTNSFADFNDMWQIVSNIPQWNGVTTAGVTESDVSVVIDMFSAYDGDIDLTTAFGASAGQTVTLTEAYQSGRKLTVSGNKITDVKPVFIMENGKKKDVAVVPVVLVGTVDGTAKTVSVGLKAYTRVIDHYSDLTDLFKDTDSTTGYDAAKANSFDGYYILKTDIDASQHTAHAYSWAASMGSNQLKSNKYFIGLRGTFDGNGHTIDGLTLTSGGLFGAINGGTVKNVAFTNVKLGSAAYGALLCWYASDALVSNVYAEIDAYSTRGKFDGSLIGDSYQCKFKDMLVVAPNYTKTTNDYGFGSFSSWYTDYKTTDGTQTTFENTYVISSTVLCQRKLNATGKTNLLYVVDAQNRTNTAVSGYTTYTLDGVYRYDSLALAGTVSVSGANWSIANGTVTWSNN